MLIQELPPAGQVPPFSVGHAFSVLTHRIALFVQALFQWISQFFSPSKPAPDPIQPIFPVIVYTPPIAAPPPPQEPLLLEYQMPIPRSLFTPASEKIEVNFPEKKAPLDAEVRCYLDNGKLRLSLPENSLNESVRGSLEVVTHQEAASAEAEDIKRTGATYFLSLFWRRERDLQPDDPVTFVEGRLVKGEGSLPLFIALLEKTYGKELTRRVCEHYHLKQDTRLTWKEVQKILLGLGAFVEGQDLALLFFYIKEDREDLLVTLYLTSEERALIKKAHSFNDLTTEQMGILLGCFRTMPSGGLKVPTSELFHLEECKEWQMLNACNLLASMDRTNPLIQREAYAREVAYLALKTGQIVPSFDEEGRFGYYRTIALPDERDGFVASFLVPIKPQEGTYTLELNFRGTQPTTRETNGLESIQRDLEIFCGAAAYKRRAVQIIQLLEELIQRAPDGPITLNINGHSLGGADVQRCLTLLTAALVNSPTSPIQRLTKIAAFAHNAPGLEEALNEAFKRNIARLNRIQIEVTYIYIASDPVQTAAGPTYVGAATRSPILKRRIIYFESSTIRSVAAHTAKPFLKCQDFRITVVTDPELIEPFLRGNITFYRMKGAAVLPLQATLALGLRALIAFRHSRA